MRAPLPLVAVLLVLGLARPPDAQAEGVEREIVVRGEARSYRIHVPSTWDRARPIPVLLVFHGAGSDAESMVRATGFDALADATPMLVVYPRAPGRTRRYDVDPPAGRTSADVELVDALLARLRGRFPVDGQRIWATGFSNGAALCYRLAAERPGVLAAIAPVAGYLPALGRAAPSAPTPLLHVHGTADTRVPPPSPAGSAGTVDSAFQTWARWNEATRPLPERRESDPSGLVLRRQALAGASPRSDTELLLVEGRGHEWSGGPGGPISRAILAFLTQHPQAPQALQALPGSPATQPPPPQGAPTRPGPAARGLVGAPLGSLDALRWLTPKGGPASIAAQPLTLFRWWTNACPHCVASLPVLARLEDRYRARGLRLVAVYHPKGRRLGDEAARAYARGLGVRGALAFDDRWTKYAELRDRGGLRQATSISVLVDASGTVRWVHPGPRLEAGSRDLAELEALLERLLPPATSTGPYS